MKPLVHLIAGSTGAGKTTYATALAAELGALRFSIDEWMVTLFGPDQPTGPPNFGWMMQRIGRCDALIWAHVLQLAAQGVPSVLDLGFTRREHRAKFAGLAREAGLRAELHHVDVPADERWRRVQQCNSEKGETYRLEVTRPMFDFVERLWEPPAAAEIGTIAGDKAGA
jgi:predicted kinase